ncbi:MAG: HD domain-containing protein [Bacteroidota bacterium]
MRTYFENIFGELLNKIQNTELRSKTLDAWEMAAKQGGWTKPEEIEKMPFTLLTQCHGINLVEHTIAVTKGAAGLAEAILGTYKPPFEINMDFIYAGGLLHDVGKLDEFELINGEYKKSLSGKCARHPFSGAIIASKAGLPIEIINMIACHAKEGDGRPQRVETVLVHQADFATFDPMVMLEKGLMIK